MAIDRITAIELNSKYQYFNDRVESTACTHAPTDVLDYISDQSGMVMSYNDIRINLKHTIKRAIEFEWNDLEATNSTQNISVNELSLKWFNLPLSIQFKGGYFGQKPDTFRAYFEGFGMWRGDNRQVVARYTYNKPKISLLDFFDNEQDDNYKTYENRTNGTQIRQGWKGGNFRGNDNLDLWWDNRTRYYGYGISHLKTNNPFTVCGNKSVSDYDGFGFNFTKIYYTDEDGNILLDSKGNKRLDRIDREIVITLQHWSFIINLYAMGVL